MSELEKFLNKWRRCRKCPDLTGPRHHVVLYRGTIPCDVLFVGEAPGKVEDAFGKPFIGPAGRLLNRLIDATVPVSKTYAITNIVCCIPTDVDNKLRQPTKEEAFMCHYRLDHFLQFAAGPQMQVVLLGEVAKKYWPASYSFQCLHAYHPAFILRKGGAESLEFQETVLKLKDFLA